MARHRAPGLRRLAAVSAASVIVAATLTATTSVDAPAAVPPAPPWAGFANDARHTGVAPASPQPLAHVRWHVRVDRDPPTYGDEGGPIAHYASPMVTSGNTVVVPTRIGASQGSEVIAYAGSDGTKKWSLPTDYTVPVGAQDQWPPPIPAGLLDDRHVAVAAAGGTLLVRARADHDTGRIRRLAFYGMQQWRAHRAAYRKAVQITTPLTTGPDGSVYFGFSATADAPGRLRSGFARISPSGEGSWVSARRLAGVHGATAVALNCAPALSNSGRTGYVAVVTGTRGRLVAFNAATLHPRCQHRLRDPQTQEWAVLSGSSTAAPTVGPDGDVYFGVLGYPLLEHDDRGWLLHFDRHLTTLERPGSFGWDSTVSVVPAASVPSYAGTSSYLLVSKY
ncbi:MAG TPA: hypothetical protein VGL02_09545, partial [Streptomyces sp.]